MGDGVIIACTSNASAFVHVDPWSVKLYDPHIRNTFALRDWFALPVCVTRPHIRQWTETPPKYAFFTVSLWFHYRETKALFQAMVDNGTELWWLYNDHRLVLPSCLKEFARNINVIANCDASRTHLFRSWTDVNLNILPMRRRNPDRPKRCDVVYCGIYRENRRPYFEKYLKGDMILAAPVSAQPHFYKAGITCRVCDGSRWSWKPGNETFNQFRYTLYIEDVELHSVKTGYPALRLYDALVCNVVTLFDTSCRKTMQRTGWPMLDDFYVDGYEELIGKVRQGEAAWRERLEYQRQWVNLALHEQGCVFKNIENLIPIRNQTHAPAP